MSSLPPTENATLLLVDDNEANRDMLSRRLARRGFTVTVAAGGQEALERIGREHYDLILLDLLMPDMSGMDVLQKIREAHSSAELPVIITSAKHEAADVIAGFGGRDRIKGLGKGDFLCGGGGRDRIFGGAGADRIFGGPGRDLIRPGPGRDQVHR